MNLEKIESQQNNHIKTLNKLSQKKYRKELGLFVVENLTIIYDALMSGYKFKSLFVTEDFCDKNKEKFEYLKENSDGAELFLIDKKINKYYSELETSSGVTAVYEIKEKKIEEGKSVVYLNGINDPGNLGTILRTCLAFGFKNVVIDSTCADIYNSKNIQSAKDAIFKLNIEKDISGNWVKNTKLPVYITNVHKGVSLEKFKPETNFCLVFGSESHGVSEDIKELAKENIRIEIKGEIESLNVSTAVAIFLYKLSS